MNSKIMLLPVAYLHVFTFTDNKRWQNSLYVQINWLGLVWVMKTTQQDIHR